MESEWGRNAEINHSKPEHLGAVKLNLDVDRMHGGLQKGLSRCDHRGRYN